MPGSPPSPTDQEALPQDHHLVLALSRRVVRLPAKAKWQRNSQPGQNHNDINGAAANSMTPTGNTNTTQHKQQHDTNW